MIKILTYLSHRFPFGNTFRYDEIVHTQAEPDTWQDSFLLPPFQKSPNKFIDFRPPSATLRTASETKARYQRISAISVISFDIKFNFRSDLSRLLLSILAFAFTCLLSYPHFQHFNPPFPRYAYGIRTQKEIGIALVNGHEFKDVSAVINIVP